MKILNKRHNAGDALCRLLNAVNIVLDDEALYTELQRHPEYPSFLALSDVLNNFGIRNEAYAVEAGDIFELKTPFIAKTKINNGDYVVVTNVSTKEVIFSDNKKGKQKLHFEDFSYLFDGFVFVVILPENAPLKTKWDIRRLVDSNLITIAALAVITLLLFQSALFSNIDWLATSAWIAKTVGFVVSVMLLLHVIDQGNLVTQKLCNLVGRADCDSILSSKAAKVYKDISWSEIGLVYFASTWAMLLFCINFNLTWHVLTLLNLLALPYTVYSLYYQYRVAKKWCSLCLVVQVSLWLEFFPLFYKAHNIAWSPTEISKHSIIALILCILIPATVWAFLKPIIIKAISVFPLTNELRDFKFNEQLFKRLLSDQPSYTTPDESWAISIGNTSARNIVTMVSNPYCQPCSDKHKQLETLVQQCDGVQARIVFSVGDAAVDKSNAVVDHFMMLEKSTNNDNLRKAMHAWYAQTKKNYDKWSQNHPAPLSDNAGKIEKHRQWCQAAKITATPTLLLNGHKLPELYQLTDLKYMLQ